MGKPWSGVTIESDTPSALTVGATTPVQADDLQQAVAVTVPADTEANSANLMLVRNADTADRTIVALLPISLVATKGPGPIPPGMKPSLDIMWKVLPRDAVADSYGARVADKYFAIEAVLGNQTMYDLQIAALGFKMPHVFCSNSVLTSHDKQDPAWDLCKDSLGDGTSFETYNQSGVTVERTTKIGTPTSTTVTHTRKDGTTWSETVQNSDQQRQISLTADRPETEPPVPVDAYPIVRGTIVREQAVGTRTLVVNLVKGTSSVLVGVGGFFADSGAFVRAVGISAGPFEKAIELIYPDLSVEHLLNLDSHTLRDGAVLPNNQSIRINAFISRDLVQCPSPANWYRLGIRARASYTCVEGDARMPWSRTFDPSEVAARLGEITLVGSQIEYVGRVRVLSKSTDDMQSKPGPVVPLQTVSARAGDAKKTVTLGGFNLQGAVVTLAVGGAGIHVTPADATATATSNTVSFDIAADADAKANDAYLLQVTTPLGSTYVPLHIMPKTDTATKTDPAKADANR